MAFRVHVREYFCFQASLGQGRRSELGMGSSNAFFFFFFNFLIETNLGVGKLLVLVFYPINVLQNSLSAYPRFALL